jgi:hypothetical protein
VQVAPLSYASQWRWCTQVSTASHGIHLERVNERADCQPADETDPPWHEQHLAVAASWPRLKRRPGLPNVDTRAQSLGSSLLSGSRLPYYSAAFGLDEVVTSTDITHAESARRK